MPRQLRPSQYQSWGPKLLQVQNLGGGVVVFFLRGQNRNFGKVRGLKLQLSLDLSSNLINFIWGCEGWILRFPVKDQFLLLNECSSVGSQCKYNLCLQCMSFTKKG